MSDLRRSYWSGFFTGAAVVVLLLAAYVASRVLPVLERANRRTPVAAAESPREPQFVLPPAHPEVMGDGGWGRLGVALSLRRADGVEVAPEELAGRVLFVTRWATWCSPCRVELPTIEALRSDFVADSRIRFLPVSTEEPEVIRRFAEGSGLELPFYLFSTAPPAVLWARVFPPRTWWRATARSSTAMSALPTGTHRRPGRC